MPDPRVDKLIAALGGEAEIDAWNAKGNSLLLGYAIEQDRLDRHIAAHPGGTMTGVTAEDIANAILGGAKFAADGIRFAAQRGSGG